jgi:hypothetical protein
MGESTTNLLRKRIGERCAPNRARTRAGADATDVLTNRAGTGSQGEMKSET